MEFFYELKTQLTTIYSPDEARNIAKITVEAITNKPLAYLLAEGAFVGSPEINQQLKIAANRLLKCEPVQYVLGKTFFWGNEYYITNGTLIPRPETEELCSMLVNFLSLKNNPSVIEPCCGSGIPLLSVAARLPQANLMGFDIDEKALDVARTNLKLYKNTNVTFRYLDIFDDNILAALNPADAILFNPPYVPHTEAKHLHKNVLDFEPQHAIFVDDQDPLIFYKTLIEIVSKKLKKGGKGFLEIHPPLGNELKMLFSKYEPLLLTDFRGNQRFLIISNN